MRCAVLCFSTWSGRSGSCGHCCGVPCLLSLARCVAVRRVLCERFVDVGSLVSCVALTDLYLELHGPTHSLSPEKPAAYLMIQMGFTMAAFASVCAGGVTACNVDTGATCFVYDYDASRGHVGCVDHAYLCLSGCATDVDGRC